MFDSTNVDCETARTPQTPHRQGVRPEEGDRLPDLHSIYIWQPFSFLNAHYARAVEKATFRQYQGQHQDQTLG